MQFEITPAVAVTNTVAVADCRKRHAELLGPLATLTRAAFTASES